YPVSEFVSIAWDSQLDKLRNGSSNYRELLVNNERAPRHGELFVNKNYGQVLRRIAKEGKDGFYKGFVAEAIVEVVKELGGNMTLEDLANHTPSVIEPISYDYNGYRMYECPPNGQGLVALEALGIIDSMVKSGKVPKISSIPHNSPEYAHILIEALRLAFSDGFFYIGDPEKCPDFDPNSLLTKEFLQTRSDQFNPSARNDAIVHGYPANQTNTVYFCTMDEQGNGCSFIGAIPKGCGFTLQNRGANFSLETDGHNLYGPGKRPYHTIIPSLITKGDDLFCVYGVMGGFMQPQGHLQVFLNMIEYGMEPQIALDVPRLCIDPEDPKEIVHLEQGYTKETEQKLRDMGHHVDIVTGHERSVFGRGQIIMRVPHGDKIVLSCGSDPRSDGCSSAK
ncbi:hypothetical protein BB560_006142, partial [Smittium megazygosporum]